MEWTELTDLTRGRRFVVERVRTVPQGVAVEGSFEPPPLAMLEADDQVFVAAFVRAHGSIKEMERLFGVSYPTVKARLNRLAAALPLVETDLPEPPPAAAQDRGEVLDRLAAGEVDVDTAVAMLRSRP